MQFEPADRGKCLLLPNMMLCVSPLVEHRSNVAPVSPFHLTPQLFSSSAF